MKISDKLRLEDMAAHMIALWPKLDSFEQRLSRQLYRLLAQGRPVERAELAQRLGSEVKTVNKILEGWPAVFSDSRNRVVGYWGLTIPGAHSTRHQMTINGRKLFAWCAWDTLFLPQLLAETAKVESTSPNSEAMVRLKVTPDRVEWQDPADAHMSFLLPDPEWVKNDVLTSFCNFIHFFPSRHAGETWAEQHAGTFLLTIDEAHLLARLKNEAQYRDALSEREPGSGWLGQPEV
jgi:alkylmercury lyase